MVRPSDTIADLKAEQRYDSRGVPTIQVSIITKGGATGTSLAPAGASTGSHEVLEVRDESDSFGGLSVKRIAKSLSAKLLPKIKSVSIYDQDLLDEILTEPNGSGKAWGGNVAVATSQAVAKAAAVSLHLSLWQYLREVFEKLGGRADGENHLRICSNVLNGGRHASGGPSFQEFWVVPNGGSVAQQLEVVAEFYFALRQNFKKNKKLTLVGDEGGLVPIGETSEATLNYLQKMLKDSGLHTKLSLGLDAAASEFGNKSNYVVDGKKYSAEHYLQFLLKLQRTFNIALMEDPLAESDLSGWRKLTEELKYKVILIGDDLFTSQEVRLEQGIEAGLANAILLKPNQVGSITGLMRTAILAQKNNYKTMVSHRSGETTDSFIADLAVAINVDFVKFGAPARGERLIKYERLLDIENEIKVGEVMNSEF